MPAKRKPQKPTRHFTRADVIADFERYVGVQIRQDNEVTIEKVSLLQGVTPPVWILEIRKKRINALMFDTLQWQTFIYVEESRPYEDEPRLSFATEITLPEGYATVPEEDAAIAERLSQGKDTHHG